jgi:pimeloyl-ACP methyl ester carboxylesterase
MPTVQYDLQTERLAFHYRAHGTPGGLPLLLVHGSYASSRWWEPLCDLLPESIYAVAPDLRGCGQSEKSETGYSIEEQAIDLAAFVQTLGWAKFDLVGHSSGGAIAIEFALQHKESLHTLILVDPVPVEGVFTPLDVLLVLEQMKSDRSLLRKALAALMPSFDKDAPRNLAFFKRLVDDAQQMAPAAFTAVAESLSRWNRFADAKDLTLPTLLLWGDQDEIVPRQAMTRTLIAIPGARNLEILQGVGHSPMIEAPLTLAERIIGFMAEDQQPRINN